jgi:hypothetical protein
MTPWTRRGGIWTFSSTRKRKCGRHVLYVPVNGSDQRQRVVNIIRDHGGYRIIHFKRWVIEHIPQ